MNEWQGMHKSIMLARSGLAIVLSVVFIMLFRGPISIISALTIPAGIALFMRPASRAHFILTSFALLIIVVIFVPTQSVFALCYIILATGLKYFIVSNSGKIKLGFFSVVAYILCASASIYLGIRLTELIFSIPLHQMMLHLSAQHFLRYLLIVLIEGVLICIANLSLLHFFLCKINYTVVTR